MNMLCDTGIPRRAAGSGGQGQEVYQAEDGAQEDCSQHHYGKRQSVPLTCVIDTESDDYGL